MTYINDVNLLFRISNRMIFLFFSLFVKDKSELAADSFNKIYDLPVVRTIDIQRYLDSFLPWLDNKHRKPFLVVGPDGCGKG